MDVKLYYHWRFRFHLYMCPGNRDDKRGQVSVAPPRVRITKAFNKKVKERIFKKGDLVLAVRRLMVMTYKTKGKF